MSQEGVYRYLKRFRKGTADEIARYLRIRRSTVLTSLRRMMKYGEVDYFVKGRKRIYFLKK